MSCACQNLPYNKNKIIAEELAYLKKAVKTITKTDKEFGLQISENFDKAREIFECLEFFIYIAYNSLFQNRGDLLYNNYEQIVEVMNDEHFVNLLRSNINSMYISMGTEQTITCFKKTIELTIEKLQDSKIDR